MTLVLPPLDPSLPPWPGRELEVGGITLHVRETPSTVPDAPTAVYLHGLAGSATNWTDLAAQLAGKVAGIAVDLPGFGRSVPPEGFDFSLPAQAGVVISLLEQLDRGPVHLFGNSMGGAIAIMVAATRPDLVATLTLTSPAVPDLRPDPRRMSDPRMALMFLPLIGPRVRRALAEMSPRARAEQVIRLVFAEPEVLPEHKIAEATKEVEERMAMPWAGAALGGAAFGLFRFWVAPPSRSLWHFLPKVSAPSLVIWGAEDKLIDVRKATRTVRLMPNARLLVLARTGHVAQLERPRQVARAVVGMLEAVDHGDW